MSIQEEIKAHTQAVLNGEVSWDQGSCPKCGTFHGSFRPHERKRRSFLIIVDRLVCKMASRRSIMAAFADSIDEMYAGH